VSLFENRRQLLPERFAVDIVSGWVITILILHRIEHASRGEGTTLTPAIAVVVDSFHESGIIGLVHILSCLHARLLPGIDDLIGQIISDFKSQISQISNLRFETLDSEI
jgi:hypothetical protein